MTATHDIRRSAGYEHIFSRVLPKFNVVEIAPIMDVLPKAVLKENGLAVMDVGANAGLWTASLLEYFGHYVGEVHMFEPMPGNLKRLHAAMSDGLYGAHVDKLRVNEHGISEQEGTATIHFENEFTGLASIDNVVSVMPASFRKLDKAREIRLDTLDAYCERNGVEFIDVLKIDIEGHELSALRGCQRLLREKKIGLVCYECGVHQLGRREFYKDFYELFDSYGYQNWRYRRPGWSPVRINEYHPRLEAFEEVQMFIASSYES